MRILHIIQSTGILPIIRESPGLLKPTHFKDFLEGHEVGAHLISGGMMFLGLPPRSYQMELFGRWDLQHASPAGLDQTRRCNQAEVIPQIILLHARLWKSKQALWIGPWSRLVTSAAHKAEPVEPVEYELLYYHQFYNCRLHKYYL